RARKDLIESEPPEREFAEADERSGSPLQRVAEKEIGSAKLETSKGSARRKASESVPWVSTKEASVP
ncbi:hypothetical protein, partial [Streptomyces pacificus]|uniref:hypothetical protein n=1 Tax=Streptomyces pacificus TaxID=2705029 RepID=UPI001C202656